MNNNGTRIFPVGKLEEAYAIKEQHPDFILVGERNERIPEGFDFGNSPTHISQHNFENKTVIHTTSAGTQGIVNATNADQIITGSFVNAEAIAKYIQKQKPGMVSLVCMGYSAQRPTEEDTFCAEYIKQYLEGQHPDFVNMKETIRKTSGQRLFLPENQAHSPSSDFDMCLDLNRFSFVLKAEYNSEIKQIELHKILI
jgi:2-phosphosulfolactate phosphatase